MNLRAKSHRRYSRKFAKIGLDVAAENGETPGTLRRRRARRRRKLREAAKQPGAITRFSQVQFALMCVVALGLGYLQWSPVAAARRSYGDLVVGMSEADVRYLYGGADRVSADGASWLYEDRGERVVVGFGADHKAERIVCSDNAQGVSRCPEVLGVHVGSTEAAVSDEIGTPASAVYDGNDKLLRYPALGLILRLRQGEVAGIEHRAPSANAVALMLWRLVP